MSDKKSSTAVLEKVKEAIPEVNISGKADPQHDTQAEAREHRVEELIHGMEKRMKQAAVDFKGSEELQREAGELSHDIAGRIRRISQSAKTEDAFERDVDEAIAAAVRYIIGKARVETKAEKKKEEAKKEHGEEKRKRITTTEEKKTEEKTNTDQDKAATETKADTSIQSTTNSPKITPSPATSPQSEKTLSPKPAENKEKPTEKSPPKKNQQEKTPSKPSQTKEQAHQAIVHALEEPETVYYRKVKPDEKLRTKMVSALEDPEEALKKQMQAFFKKRQDGFANRMSYKNQQRVAEERRKKAEAVALAGILSAVKEKSHITIPQGQDQEEELIETTSGEELMDRGSTVTGNPNADVRTQTASTNKASPPPPGEENYSVRDYSGQQQARKAAAQHEEAGGGRKRKKKKKIRKKIEEKIGAKVARELLLLIVKSPYFWIAVLIIYVILFIISILGAVFQDAQGNNSKAPSLLTLTKTGPATATVGQNLTYTINAQYKGSAQELTIVDKLPTGVNYVSSNPTGVYDATARTVTWNTKSLNVLLTNPANWSVTVVLRATSNNVKIVNQATATVTGGASGEYVSPSTSDCNNANYKSYMNKTPLKKNFGDPMCDFSKDELFKQLQTEDPTNADIWFNKIVPCESGYNPNAYAGPQTGTPDARGAWGLYQMGSSNPPGSPPPAEGKNGPNDRGDVPWRMQTSNATTYGKKIGSLGRYWACAR